MRIKIHTQGWRGSAPIKAGEQPGGLHLGLLELDGQVYSWVNDINVNFGDGFATVTVTLIPGDIDVVTHDKDSWEKICKKADAREQLALTQNSKEKTITVYVSPGQDE